MQHHTAEVATTIGCNVLENFMNMSHYRSEAVFDSEQRSLDVHTSCSYDTVKP